MTISVSNAVFNDMLDNAAFNSVMDLMFLNVYAGTVPTNSDPALPDAEAALGGATLLRTYTVSDDGSTGLGWEASAAANVLSKDSTETWSGTSVAAGTATFFRGVLAGDTGNASTTEKRIQGSVGVATGDLLLDTVSISSSVLHEITNFSVYLASPA